MLVTERSVSRPVAEQFFSTVDYTTRTYGMLGNVDGGLGQDTLVLSFDSPWWTHAWGGDAVAYSGATTPVWKVDLHQWALTSLEKIEVTGFAASTPWTYPAEFIVSAQQLSALQSATGLRSVSIVGGGHP